MTSRTKTRTFRLPVELDAAVVDLAQKAGTSPSDMIERLLTEALRDRSVDVRAVRTDRKAARGAVTELKHRIAKALWDVVEDWVSEDD